MERRLLYRWSQLQIGKENVFVGGNSGVDGRV